MLSPQRPDPFSRRNIVDDDAELMTVFSLGCSVSVACSLRPAERRGASAIVSVS